MRSRIAPRILAIALALLIPTAGEAAKGIISTAPLSGAGSVIVTEDPTPTTMKGTEIPAPVLPSGIEEGDLVTFDIVPSPIVPGTEVAEGIALFAKGSVITTSMTATVGVTALSPKIIQGAIVIDGKINVSGGTLVIRDDATINGKVDVSNGGSIVIQRNVQISGKVETNGSKLLKIDSSRVDGPVKSANDAFVVIKGCTIEGKLEITSQPTEGCNLTDNTVSGSTRIPPACGP